MKAPAPERSGLLILRLWIERDPVTGLRARITHALDSTGMERVVATASTEDQVYGIVRTWVRAFVDGSAPPNAN